jgi:hypothetical protein
LIQKVKINREALDKVESKHEIDVNTKMLKAAALEEKTVEPTNSVHPEPAGLKSGDEDTLLERKTN